VHSLLDSSDCEPGSYSLLPSAFTFLSAGDSQPGCCETHISPIAQRRFLSSYPFVGEDDPASQPHTRRLRCLAISEQWLPSDDDRTLWNRALAGTQSVQDSGAWDYLAYHFTEMGVSVLQGPHCPASFAKGLLTCLWPGERFAYWHLNSSPPKKSPQNRGGFVKIASQLAASCEHSYFTAPADATAAVQTISEIAGTSCQRVVKSL
jgi:hypothetical protein